MTHDALISSFLSARELPSLAKAFPAGEFYLPPEETILAELEREQSGTLQYHPLEWAFKADIYLTNRIELNAWGFRNAPINSI